MPLDSRVVSTCAQERGNERKELQSYGIMDLLGTTYLEAPYFPVTLFPFLLKDTRKILVTNKN